jgi:hypothetical protein
LTGCVLTTVRKKKNVKLVTGTRVSPEVAIFSSLSTFIVANWKLYVVLKSIYLLSIKLRFVINVRLHYTHKVAGRNLSINSEEKGFFFCYFQYTSNWDVLARLPSSGRLNCEPNKKNHTFKYFEYSSYNWATKEIIYQIMIVLLL